MSIGEPFPRFQNIYTCYPDKKLYWHIVSLEQHVKIVENKQIIRLGHNNDNDDGEPAIEIEVPLPDKAWVVLGCDDDIHGNLTWIHKVYYNENKARQSVNNLNAILGHFKAKYPNFEVIDPELRSQKIKYLKQQLGDHNENIVNWHHLQYAVQEVELS